MNAGVKVNALSGEDAPVIEASGIAAQVPFANHAGVVAGGLKVFGDGGLGAVEAVEGGHAVEVAVFAGEDRRPAGGADGVNGEAAVEPHAGAGEAIEVGRLVDLAAVGADGLSGVVVAHDEKDVRRLSGRAEKLDGKSQPETQSECGGRIHAGQSGLPASGRKAGNAAAAMTG